MTTLSFKTINTRGLGNYKKRKEFLNKFWYPLAEKPPDILFLQECHSSKACESQWKKDFQSRYVYFSHNTTSAGGLMIVIRNNVPFVLKHVVTTVDYMLVHCQIAKEEYVLVNIHNHMFNVSHYHEKITEWFHKIWDAVKQFPCHRILLAGDFNIGLDPLPSGCPVTYHSRTGTTFLQMFLEETELTDCWRLFHPNDNRNTCYQKFKSSITGSRIDFVFVSPLLLNYLVSSEIELAFQSDHCPVSALFLLNRNKKGRGVFRFPDFLTSDENYNKILADTIQDVVKAVHDDNPVEL